MPDVVGYTIPLANQVLSEAGLRLRNLDTRISEIVPRGIVILSTPDTGTRDLLPNSPVDLLVSVGPPKCPLPQGDVTGAPACSYVEPHGAVPLIVGETFEEANRMVTAVGLYLHDISYKTSKTISRGRVIASSPPAGMDAATLRVDVVMSTG